MRDIDAIWRKSTSECQPHARAHMSRLLAYRQLDQHAEALPAALHGLNDFIHSTLDNGEALTTSTQNVTFNNQGAAANAGERGQQRDSECPPAVAPARRHQQGGVRDLEEELQQSSSHTSSVRQSTQQTVSPSRWWEDPKAGAIDIKTWKMLGKAYRAVMEIAFRQGKLQLVDAIAHEVNQEPMPHIASPQFESQLSGA